MKILKFSDFIKEAERAPIDDPAFFKSATYFFESPIYVTVDVDGWIEKNKKQGSPQMFIDGISQYLDVDTTELSTLIDDPDAFYQYAEEILPGNYEIRLSDSAINPDEIKYSLINIFNDKGDPSQFATVMGLGSIRAIDVTDDGNFKIRAEVSSLADDAKLQEIEDFLKSYLERNINQTLENKPISLGIGKPSVILSVYSDEPEWFMKSNQ